LTLPRRDDGITRNQLGEDTTSSLDAERERADINQNNVGSSFRTRKDTSLNGSTISDSLIRVDSL
jgi:hypothetical protein